MSVSYTKLEAKAATLLADYGQTWSITRGGTLVGRINGIKTKAENSGVRSGLTLAANRTVDLILAATPKVKVGDVLSVGTGATQYIVASVNLIEPAGTTVVQKVSAA